MEREKFLKKNLPELSELENFINTDCAARVETIEIIGFPPKVLLSQPSVAELPIYKFSYGSQDKRKPVLILVGGVHGLERIGTQVVKSLLFSFNELTLWDEHVMRALKNLRVLFIPLLNPWGMALNRRSNANGIDLMRNAPVDAIGETVPLLSGHRIGSILPWYRGDSAAPMELESRSLVTQISEEVRESRAAISLDMHSGFGFKDQLWFPYAKSTEPFGHLAEMMAIKEALDKTYPYHVYQVEPQAINYVTHGDLWDYLYDEHCKISDSTFIPLCLEMGSWNWVRKNPSQLFLPGGIFDPILPHRRHRAFRRHHLLFDLLVRLMLNPDKWSRLNRSTKTSLERKAHETWYPKNKH